MQLRQVERALDEVVIVEPEIFEDDRGFFMETFRVDQFAAMGLPTAFVQDNHSRSGSGVVRGLHFQHTPQMGKLMRVTVGSAFLVAVDIRKGSPTVGQWVGFEVSAENRRQIWAPAWFARGMCPLSDVVEIQYKCTGIYSKAGELSIRWDDPEIGIEWPIDDPLLSERDRHAITLQQWLDSPEAELFSYERCRPALTAV